MMAEEAGSAIRQRDDGRVSDQEFIEALLSVCNDEVARPDLVLGLEVPRVVLDPVELVAPTFTHRVQVVKREPRVTIVNEPGAGIAKPSGDLDMRFEGLRGPVRRAI